MKTLGVKYVLPEDRERLVKAFQAYPRDYAIFLLLLMTGMRVGELERLNVGDVEGKTLLRIIGKGQRIRELPLAQSTQELITKHLMWKRAQHEPLEAEAPLFYSRKHHRLSAREIRRLLENYSRKAGCSRIYSPHALRHTVGFELLQKTGNLRFVQAYLGHANISTTQIYTSVTTENLQRCAELLAA